MKVARIADPHANAPAFKAPLECARERGTPLSAEWEAALASAFRLAENCHYEAAHTHQVTQLALQIFDCLRELHGLAGVERSRLQCAGLLHDIGWIEGQKGHHKTSRRIILTSPLLKLHPHERAVIGEIARYHRRALPDEQRHRRFSELSPDDRHCVRVLAGILRVADGLDVSHRSIVRNVACRVTDALVEVRCATKGAAQDERKAALKKGNLFKEVFQRNLEVVMASE